MYKKYLAALALVNLIVAAAVFDITGIKANRILSTPAFRLQLADALSAEELKEQGGAWTYGGAVVEAVSSGQRVIDYEVLKKQARYALSEEEYEILLRIVEAEAGGEDETGKMLVAGVVLNRVESDAFPDTVEEVVFQRENGVAQFSPAYSGRYAQVTVSDETVSAVEKVLGGEDITGGALYFASRKYADPEKMRWFDRHLSFLFSHGGHDFYTN